MRHVLKRFLKIFALLATALILFLIFASLFTAYMILHPTRVADGKTPSSLGYKYENVTFTTADGITIKGWFIPTNSSNASIILAHGYHDRKASMLEYAPFLHERGYNLLLFDFRAHGESGGDTATFGYRESNDVIAAADFLEKNKNASRIGALGGSMGAASSVMAAGKSDRIKAVVSDVGFADFGTSAQEGFTDITGLPAFPFVTLTVFFGQILGGMSLSDIAPAKYIGNISPRAVFIVNSAHDEVVGPRAGYMLYNAAKEPKSLWVVTDAEHGKIHEKHREEYEKKVLEFFGTYL